MCNIQKDFHGIIDCQVRPGQFIRAVIIGLVLIVLILTLLTQT